MNRDSKITNKILARRIQTDIKKSIHREQLHNQLRRHFGPQIHCQRQNNKQKRKPAHLRTESGTVCPWVFSPFQPNNGWACKARAEGRNGIGGRAEDKEQYRDLGLTPPPECEVTYIKLHVSSAEESFLLSSRGAASKMQFRVLSACSESEGRFMHHKGTKWNVARTCSEFLRATVNSPFSDDSPPDEWRAPWCRLPPAVLN